MKTPQVTEPIQAPTIGNEPTFMAERDARKLASVLSASDDWRYRAVMLGSRFTVQVWDENGFALGYL